MRYRRLTLIFIATLAAFVGGNYLIWKCWTEHLLSDRQYQGGDLARMGYIYGSKHLRTNSVNLPKRHIESIDYIDGSVDLVTIGDSYSKGGGSGPNHYYQDYISTLHNMHVLNMPVYTKAGEDGEFSHMQTAIRLANSGYLKNLGVTYLLLQSVERWSITRFAGKPDFTLTATPAELRTYYASKENIMKQPELSFLNNGNLKFFIHTIQYQLSDNAFRKRVYCRQLEKHFFSVRDSDRLLFFVEDIRNIAQSTSQAVEQVNENLNELSEFLHKQGIKLIFMPCVDKYNLYSDYIINNPYPRSTFFEELRKLPKKYVFIDTKAILAEELRKGEQDIFYADDTHWSWKASKKIFESIRFK